MAHHFGVGIPTSEDEHTRYHAIYVEDWIELLKEEDLFRLWRKGEEAVQYIFDSVGYDG